MKNLAKLFLIILFVPFCLATILIATIKFQILDGGFWKTTLKNNNVYTNLSVVLKTAAENQTEKGGGKKNDIGLLTDIVTPKILEDFISRNFDNIFGFANNKKKELLIYIPKVVNFNSEELPLVAFLSKFHMAVGQDLPISQIGYVGIATTYSFILLFTLSLLCFFLLFILTESGKKFIAPGLAFIFSGVILLATTVFGYVIRMSMLTDWIKGKEPSQILLSTFAPYILQEILKVWTIVGISLLILGIILVFIKKYSH